MKITYIHHSSFSVELDNSILLFDYFKGKLPDFDKSKKLYVFSSHSHHDHFSNSIFKLEKIYKDVTYILSDDIKTSKSFGTDDNALSSNSRFLSFKSFIGTIIVILLISFDLIFVIYFT